MRHLALRPNLIGAAVVVGAFFSFCAPALAAEHFYNGDMSVAGSVDVLAGVDAKARPDGWLPAGHGDNTRYYVYGTWQQYKRPDARMAKVKVSRYESGNASWISQDMPVTPGASYTLAHWYRSNAPSTLGLKLVGAGGAVRWQWLNTFPATLTQQQIPVARTFTVPADVTSIAVYRAISSLGWLEVGQFSLVDSGAFAPLPGGNMVRNGGFVEVDKNNEPVGWHHTGSGANVREYGVTPCSYGADESPAPGGCPVAYGYYLTMDMAGAGEMSWYTDDMPLAALGPSRRVRMDFSLASVDEVRLRIRFLLDDGTSQFADPRILSTEGEEGVIFWGGAQTGYDIPENATAFSFWLTKETGDLAQTRLADLRIVPEE